MRIRTVLTARRISLCLVLALTCISLSGCTNTNRLGYKFLDWYIYWKVERFVDLDSEQKKSTKAAIKTFHIWHRKTQLPLYADYIQQFQSRLKSSPLSGDDIHAETDKIQDLLDLSLEPLLSSAAPIISSLKDKQVIEILENIDEELDEYIDEYVDISDKKRINQHRKDITDFFKPWTGRFNKDQKALVNTWAKTLEPFERLNAAQQQYWRTSIKKLLDNRADQQALLRDMKGIMFYRTDNWQPELEEVLDRNQQRTYELIANLLNSLTPKQQQKLHNRLTDHREDFLFLNTQSVN